MTTGLGHPPEAVVPERSGAEVPIRRLDWRFMLPEEGSGGTPRSLLVLGGPPGVAARARELGFVEPDREGPGGGKADVVAVLAGSDVHPERAADAVRTSGVIYWEVDRLRKGSFFLSPTRLARRLGRAGLKPVSLHACLPGFAECKLYLPLDVPHALPWYLRSLFPSDSMFRRLLAAALALWTRGDGRRASALVPWYAIMSVPAPAIRTRPGILEHPGLSAHVGGPDVRTVMLTDAGNRVALLPFEASERDPRVVLKVPKVPQVNDRTENEHARLRELREGLPAPLADRMPRPLALVQRAGLDISAESYLPGRSLVASSGAWARSWRERSKDLQGAARWIADFHRNAEIRRGSWDRRTREEWVKKPTDDYRDAFGTEAAEDRLFSAWAAFADDLDGVSFPLVWQHRDYNVWNIFRSDTGISVIDWEGAQPGVPLCDLLHFVIHWHETVRGLKSDDDRLRGFRELFLTGSRRPSVRRISAAVTDAVDLYLDQMDLDRRLVPPLLLHTWVELALRRRRQQVDMGEDRDDPRDGNRNFPYVELLASRADQLFGGRAGDGAVLRSLAQG